MEELTRLMKLYELKKEITKFLLEMKMKTSSLGFNYWLSAIDYSVFKMFSNEYDMPRMNEIYSLIARKHNTSISCAEKAMRYAKEESQYKIIFNIEHNLKNNDFLTLCTDKIIEKCFTNSGVNSRK